MLKQNKIAEHAVLSKTLATRAMRAKSYDEIHNTFTVPCEKSKIVSFTFSIIKKK